VIKKLVLFLLATASVAAAAPVHLRTNSLTEPLGIGTPQPTFSWRSDATTQNWMQGAYEILVATSEARLLPGKADAWDSGKVNHSDSVDVVYAGVELHSQQRYFWKVIVWDKQGVSAVSAADWFETGLLHAADWKAKWIRRVDPQDEQEVKNIRWVWLANSDPTHVVSSTQAQFRYRLHLDAAPQAASLHILVRGTYTARVNGKISGQHDEWGAFDREEITSLLHAGDNEILLEVSSHNAGKGVASPAAIAASIHLTTADGREQRIVSNADWQGRAMPDGQWQSARVAGVLSAKFSIGTDRQEAVAGPDRVVTDASLLRKEFNLSSGIRSARLSVTALGAYVAYLNGKPVAPTTLLAPGWTEFHKRTQYQTYDVTNLLTTGGNAIGVMLGGGWYSSPMTWIGYRETPGPDLLRVQLEVTYNDGHKQTIITDNSWQTAPAPVTFSEIYGGESYDSRLLQVGWSAPGFAATQWSAAVDSQPNDEIAIVAQPDLPIHNNITLQPLSINPENDSHPTVYDMGQNMVGNVLLHVRGPRGVVVKLRYAERLNDDGSIYTKNLRNAEATDTYVLSGKGDEAWTPAFTFHGFRYVELSVLGGKLDVSPTISTIEGLVYNSLPDTPTVRLNSSNAILNKMNELGAWGQRGNFVSVPTDCPQRDERLGWMGDAGAFWRTGTYNFDTDAFTRKFMQDIIDAQEPEGAFTDVSPNMLGTRPGAPGWGDAGILIPYAAWLQFNDLSLVRNSWPAMERYMDFILKNNPDHIRRNALGANFGDWLAPDPKTSKVLIGTAYWALVAKDMAELATAMHRPEDAKKYQQEYEAIAAAYRAAFIKPDGSVDGNTQTSYIATLYTGIAPASLRENMVQRLGADITAHDNHLTSGFLGTVFLMYTLDENQQSDLAFKLLLTDTYPSWGYMVKKGATTWWERWNGDTGDPSMNSYNHYAFGSVMAWVYRRAAGIDTDAAGAGFHHIVIHPHFNEALPQLHVEYDSDYGTIISEWKASEHQFTVTIPANTTATVILPKQAAVEVGSGTYTYRVQ